MAAVIAITVTAPVIVCSLCCFCCSSSGGCLRLCLAPVVSSTSGAAEVAGPIHNEVPVANLQPTITTTARVEPNKNQVSSLAQCSQPPHATRKGACCALLYFLQPFLALRSEGKAVIPCSGRTARPSRPPCCTPGASPAHHSPAGASTSQHSHTCTPADIQAASRGCQHQEQVAESVALHKAIHQLSRQGGFCQRAQWLCCCCCC